MDVNQSTVDAEAALAEVARIRVATQKNVLTMKWQTSVLWGLIFLGSVLTWLSIERGEVSMLYWFVAVPLGLAATWRFESPMPRLAGSQPFSGWFLAISTLMVVGSFGTWYVFDERLSTLIWFTVLLGGFAALEALDRQYWLVAGVAVLWSWGAAVWLFTGDAASGANLTLALLATALGAGLLGSGFGQRMRRP